MNTAWVYRETDAGWTVGYYNRQGEWLSDSDHKTKGEAAERVHYLNGGAGTAYSRPSYRPTDEQVR